jgi:hypothetical protein
VRAYGDGGLVVVVGAMPHQGAWESHAQGEAVQADNSAGGSARDVHMLNWRTAAAGEPCDAETVTHGSYAWNLRKGQFQHQSYCSLRIASPRCRDRALQDSPAFQPARSAGDAALDRGG